MARRRHAGSSRRVGRWPTVVAMMIGAVIASPLASTPPVAAGPGAGDPGPTVTGAWSSTSCGSVTYVVGDTTFLLKVDVSGADGAAGGDGGQGGGPSQVFADVPVFPGESLTVDVGCAGSGDRGGSGFGRGGDGYTSSVTHSGGGGGASAIRHGAEVMLVAGGGGGASAAQGGDGGRPPSPGGKGFADKGGCGGCQPGPDGGAGQGWGTAPGGGGGGGYPGGGGGPGNSSGGGGGATFTSADAQGVSLRLRHLRGDGRVFISPQATPSFTETFGTCSAAPIAYPVPERGWPAYDVDVAVIGGAGGHNPANTVPGGGGAIVTGTVPAVATGEQLGLVVGCAGASDSPEGGAGGASGYAAGGRGGSKWFLPGPAIGTAGGGGGGASAILGSGGAPLVIAGGGGGAGGDYIPNCNLSEPCPPLLDGGRPTAGGDGGDPPNDGADCPGPGDACFGGIGGIEANGPGGVGGSIGPCPGDAPLSPGSGGGGGGYRGGGSGSWPSCPKFGNAAGGGAGSSYVDRSVINPAYAAEPVRGAGAIRLTFRPSRAGSSLSVTASKSSFVAGDEVTFTAAAAPLPPAVPTGTMRFTLDGEPLGSELVALDASGRATSVSTSSLTVGAHTLEADYSGDPEFSTAKKVLSFSVGKGPSSVGVTFTPSRLVDGVGASFVASVAVSWPGGPTPTGTVQFTLECPPTADPACSPTGTVGGPWELDASGRATSGESEPLTFGTHAVLASYSGDGNYEPSTTTVSPFASGDAFVSLVPSHNPIIPSSPETLTFTVAVEPVGGVSQVPTGTVSLTVDGGQPLVTTDGSPLGSLRLAEGGVTSPAIDESKLSLGHHTVVAAYAGDDAFVPASASVSLRAQASLDSTPRPAIRPDARIVAGDGTELGDGIYNGDGTGQTHTRFVGSVPETYQLIIENDGTAPSVIRVHLVEPAPGFAVEYRLVAGDGTREVLPAGAVHELVELRPGDMARIEMVVTVTDSGAGTFDALLRVEAKEDETALDTVRVVTTATRPGLSPAVPVIARPQFTG